MPYLDSIRNLTAISFYFAFSSTIALANTQFIDVTDQAGLGGYLAQSGDGHGPGAVFADLDNDGFPDLYVMRAWGNPNHLYLNRPGLSGSRVFQRAPNDAGAGDPGNATGAVAGDYDNDGDLDLFVINFNQPNVLLQNRVIETGVVNFVDVTAQTDSTPGVNDDQHGLGVAFHEGVALDDSLTAAWSDVDRDGDLDLFVGNHNSFFTADNPPEGPFGVPGRRDVFYLNNGNGTFSDVTMQYGVPGYISASGSFTTANQRFSSTNAVVFADFNNDRWPDLLVTNKVGGPDDRDILYVNRGQDGAGVWQGFEVATYALSPRFGDRSGGAMGVEAGDLDSDGDIDIYISDWSNLDNPGNSGSNDYWVNQFANTGQLSFIHSAQMPAVFSWGTLFQDFDNDGLQDVHVGTAGPARDYLYLNTGQGFSETAQNAGVAQQANVRGNPGADFNRDGWTDYFTVNIDQSSKLYENRSVALHPERHYLVVKLVGDVSASSPFSSTRDAVGARLVLRADLNGDGVIGSREIQYREVVAGSGNAASTSSLEQEFGLGLAQSGSLEIAWPSGRLSVHDLGADQFVVIEEESSGSPPTGSSIEIIAAGRNNQESMALQIDGVTVANFDNVGGDAQTRTFEVYSYLHPSAISSDRIRVAFTNDLHGTDPAIWRDLRVDAIQVDGVRYESEAAYSTGSWDSTVGCGPGFKSSEWLHCNGYFEYGGGSTGSVIEISAAGRNNQESMALQIDGETVTTFDNVGGDAVAGTFVVSRYSHPVPVSADRVRVVFSNDLHGPDPALWRDLRVDRITLDGVRYESEAAFSTGSWTSPDGCAPGFKTSEWLHCDGYFEYAQ